MRSFLKRRPHLFLLLPRYCSFTQQFSHFPENIIRKAETQLPQLAHPLRQAVPGQARAAGGPVWSLRPGTVRFC